MATVIIHGPKASGKTTNAKQFKLHYGCRHIVDEWMPGDKVPCLDRALILTTEDPPFNIPRARVIHIDTALRAIGKQPRGGQHA